MESQLRYRNIFDSYKVSPERALNEFRSRLSDEMKGIIVHIESEEDYEAIDELRSMINGRFSDDIRIPKLFRDRILVNKMNQLKSSDPISLQENMLSEHEGKRESKRAQY